MPFKSLLTLVNTMRGWFSPRQVGEAARPKRSQVLVSTFRRLEKRRVFAVDAFFVAGALEIEVTSVGETNANLLADGTDFFVDNNNNLAFELGEVRGAISDLQSVRAFSLESIGKLFWNGDFSLAPLAIPLGTGEVVRSEGLSEVHLQADFNAVGNVGINAIDTIDFDANMVIQGNLAATVSPTGNIVDGTNAAIQVLGDAVLQSQNSIQLADEATSSWGVAGLTKLESLGNVELGLMGSWDSSTLTVTANDIRVLELNSISIQTISASGDFELTALGTIGDEAGARFIVDGAANLNAVGSIQLADNWTDVLSVNGAVSLVSTTDSVTVSNPGTVSIGDFSASGTSVNLFEESSTELASIATLGRFSATSTGTITDAPGANVQAAAMSLNATGSIVLADDVTDIINVSGPVSILSATGQVSIASAGTVTLGSVSASGTSVLLFEDADTTLAFIQTPGGFNANSTGMIADVAGAVIQADTMNLNAFGLIQLADNAGDVLDINDSVLLVSTTDYVLVANAGVVTMGNVSASGTSIMLYEDANTTLASIATPGSFVGISIGTITDIVNANVQASAMNLNAAGSILLADNASDLLNISGAVTLVSTTSSVTIATLGTVTLGDISASGTNITLFEDADTTLASIQTLGNFSATSTGAISDVAGANIQTASMDLYSAEAIHLANDTADIVLVTGHTFLVATTRIDIDSTGSANFGSIGFIGNSVVVFEDSSTQLDGSNVGQLELHARDRVTQSGIDTGAGTTVLRAVGAAHLSLLESSGNVDLYRASSNPPNLLSDGRLLDNKIDGVFTAEGIKGDFRFRNASTQATIGTILGTFDDLTIWHTQASIILPNQVFQVAGNLELIAGMDVRDPTPLSSNPIDQIPKGDQGITDSGTRLNVDGDVHLLAAGNIVIGDASGESLQVNTGSTSIVTLGGGQVSLGGAGATTLAELGIYSQSIIDGQRGNIVVQADSSVALVNPSMPIPDGSPLQFTANSISIQTAGDLSNKPNTQISATGNLNLVAFGNFDIANNTGDSLRVAGTSDLTSRAGAIALGLNGTVALNDVNLNALAGTVSVGGPGRTELGTIEVRAIEVSIQEETVMTIRAAIATNRLTLASDQGILNTVAFVPNGSHGISARELVVDAGTYAHLGRISIDRFTGTVHANAALSSNTLFALNQSADLSGQSYLNAVGENLPPGVTSLEPVLSGETITELRSKSSFIQTFGIEYGLFVQNNKVLTIQEINATGDAIRLMVETDRGADLIVAGTVHQRFTNTDPGGVVLIAGNHLILNQGAELRIEHVSPDVATTRVILQPNLVASAFDGGRGPAGYQSTRDVLYASDAFADTGTQNVLQKVSTQFGIAGEAGFQTLIRYADGSSQLFDANEELDASLQSNPSANTRQGVVSAHASTAGDAAVVERKFAFADEFLGTFQTLPTSALFRRSAEFFLFEQSGAVDASVTRVDLTPVVDLVGDVFSPGRKVSLSLPTEIIVTPSILVAPIRIAPDAASSYAMDSNDTEPIVLSDARFEVFIVNVGFDDSNRDGQPSDSELPSRNEVRVDSIVAKENATQEIETQNAQPATRRLNLSPGEPDSSSQEFKSKSVPTAEDIEAWITQYKGDPTKPSGAYAIISVDSVTGVKVLKVFGVRDFDANQPDPSTESNSIIEPDGQPEADLPKVPIEPDKSTSSIQQNANPYVDPIGSTDSGQLGMIAAGVALGAVWTGSNDTGNRFGRLARSLRALHRNLIGS